MAAGQGTAAFGGALASVVGHVEADDPDYFRFTGLDTGGAVHPRARVSGLEGGRVCLLLRCQSGAANQFSCAKGEATLGDGDLDACCSEQGDVEASYACQGASKTANMIVVVTTAAAACQPYQLDVAF
ncbi:MAG: hypothetical protein IT477_10385 [Rhodanobacteraceae bacterium]|nr:hypothetical protein [Rhodanobacteraceae bacterium]